MLKSKILYKTILLIAIIIASYIGAILIHAFPKINNKVTSLEKINIEEVLSKVVLISKISYNNTANFKKETLKNYERNLENISLLPLYILNKHYANNIQNKQLALKEISNLKYPNSVKVSILNKKEEYENIFTITPKKIRYAKEFKPWNIYIVLEKNINNLNNKVKKREDQLFDRLNKIIKTSNTMKFGNSFLFNEKGEILVSQNDEIKKINLKKQINPNTNNSLFDDYTQAAKTTKTLKYNWNKPDDINNYTYEKILWITYDPQLHWYVATTSYVEELEVMSNKLQKLVGSLGLLTFLAALIISFVFFKRLLHPISTLSNMANSATKGDYSVRSIIKSNDEIGQLSKNFNVMIETIEKNINKEKQIIEQSRLAQMGEIMSMIAHQWRQPLGAIGSAIVNIQINQKSKKYDLENKDDIKLFLKQLNKKLTSMEEYVQFLSTTIDDFRLFFKQDSDKKLIALTVPILKALKMIKTSMSNKNIMITNDFKTNDDVLIYNNELMQVFLTILKNSEDNFLEKNIQNPTININTKRQDNNYIISFTDNGGGISENILSKIFEPYFSTKLEKNGTGLGLYMSKVIIEDHHKGILQASNVKNGIKFEIILHK
ncbi:MAG TPA: HAMP domain-containing protein [Crocinitomix sp.]|nr:HAMP domain-containing protein [Crocinitomix sp.]